MNQSLWAISHVTYIHRSETLFLMTPTLLSQASLQFCRCSHLKELTNCKHPAHFCQLHQKNPASGFADSRTLISKPSLGLWSEQEHLVGIARMKPNSCPRMMTQGTMTVKRCKPGCFQEKLQKRKSKSRLKRIKHNYQSK